jgi:hypothetical protein
LEATTEHPQAVATLQQAQDQGIISAGQYNEAMKRMEERSSDVSRAYEAVGDSISNAFKDAIKNTRDAKSIIIGLLEDIADEIWKQTAGKAISNGVSSLLSGMFTASSGGGSSAPELSTGLLDSLSTSRSSMSAPALESSAYSRGGMAVAPVTMVVNNESGAKVETSESTGSNGERLITQTIIDTVAGSMGVWPEQNSSLPLHTACE